MVLKAKTPAGCRRYQGVAFYSDKYSRDYQFVKVNKAFELFDFPKREPMRMRLGFRVGFGLQAELLGGGGVRGIRGDDWGGGFQEGVEF